jgi:hypothetical protein
VIFLIDLARWIADAGVAVLEYDGWESRARSSGGYADGRPWCVMWHHTASDAHPADDAAYCAEGSPDAPICNVLIDRTGTAWVIAAGATNTNGKGYALSFSRGTVPDDQMNTYAVGVEICNTGTGEPYPQAQIDAAFAVSLAITNGLGLEPTDAAQHHDWAPDRKIDPARADAVHGSWEPHPVNTSGSWSLVDLRAELSTRAGTGPPPPPPQPPQEDDMIRVAWDQNGTGWAGNGIQRRIVDDVELMNNYILLGCVNASGQPVRSLDDITTIGAVTLEAIGVRIA